MEINAAFQWKCQPKAEALISNVLEQAIQKSPFVAALAHDLQKLTSTRLFDWIDHIAVGPYADFESGLLECGFTEESASSRYRVFSHPGAQLPRVVVYDRNPNGIEIALLVESIENFLMVRGIASSIEGAPFARYRRCRVSSEHGVALQVVERRGVTTMEPAEYDDTYLSRYFEAQQKWKTRPRDVPDETVGMETAISIAQDIVNAVGQDLAACIILECERDYWQSRNTAAQVQKNRQDRLGMGWANHDHHTFRSSRSHFSQLVRLFEILGFHCRERFYAGEEAGWGAQVMENPRCRLVLFLDVDLSAEEIAIDFSHHPLPELERLGTIGLWCALHGDSILKSGMHHLEAQFLFEELTKDLSHLGVSMMDPFSSFPYLKQAFTHGELWTVNPVRVEKLVKSKKITKDQSEKFLSYGAVGSHLENLQRREGYKGFNQKNVSFIIKKTDPRKNI